MAAQGRASAGEEQGGAEADGGGDDGSSGGVRVCGTFSLTRRIACGLRLGPNRTHELHRSVEDQNPT